MKSIYWFRYDLRVNDNISLNKALDDSDEILFVYIQDLKNFNNSDWGFPRMGNLRKTFILQGLNSLNLKLNEHGHSLNVYQDDPVKSLIKLVKKFNIDRIYCESIDAYEELDEEKRLIDHKIDLLSIYQSGLYLNDQIPFTFSDLPDVFTQFRKKIELSGVKPIKPALLSKKIRNVKSINDEPFTEYDCKIKVSPNSSFPISTDLFSGGESRGYAYLKSYFDSIKPSKYKKTRNELTGIDFSTKFSPWLANGYLSPRQIYEFLSDYELNQIKNDSTYWIFFELLWREYFRLILKKYGKRIFNENGLGFSKQKIKHIPENFKLWIEGKTQSNFINAGMIELKESGFLSNRMRQIVASYLVNELSCDWRAGAAWFESQLIDYDVSSNQCNWAYIAGFGTDPRGGRHFNVNKQKSSYDPDNRYEKLWI